jgi:uncharacterized OsmC-like protein
MTNSHDPSQHLKSQHITSQHIRQSLASVAQHFAAHPQDALSRDSTAVAVVEDGLRARAQGPGGFALVSDMPKAVGGGGSAPTPGWLLRAALANCDASVIAMRAAQQGIVLSRLEVTVDSDSDDRGLLGLAEGVPAGPLQMRVLVRIASDSATPEVLQEIVHWAEAHSAVGDALRRAVPCATEVVIG